jgi:general secretion pathway protein N
MRVYWARTVRGSAWWAGVGALVGIMVALIWFAPARWVAEACSAVTGGRLTLPDAQGSVWQGSAQWVLSAHGSRTDGTASVRLPGRIDWAVAPSWQGLDIRLMAACCMNRPLRLGLRAVSGGVRLEAQDHRSHWPADALSGLGTPWNTLALQGHLTLSSSVLSLEWSEGRSRLNGQAVMQAEDLSTRLSTLAPLGHYQLTLLGGDVNRLQLQTLGGSLELIGAGQWVGGHLRFVGEASARPGHEEALSNMLNIIGRRSGARSIIQLG